MNGKELYEQFISKRDYSGSHEDEYAQLLDTLFFYVGDDLFPLLEKAESEGKSLSITEDDQFKSDYFLSDIILV